MTKIEQRGKEMAREHREGGRNCERARQHVECRSRDEGRERRDPSSSESKLTHGQMREQARSKVPKLTEADAEMPGDDVKQRGEDRKASKPARRMRKRR